MFAVGRTLRGAAIKYHVLEGTGAEISPQMRCAKSLLLLLQLRPCLAFRMKPVSVDLA